MFLLFISTSDVELQNRLWVVAWKGAVSSPPVSVDQPVDCFTETVPLQRSSADWSWFGLWKLAVGPSMYSCASCHDKAGLHVHYSYMVRPQYSAKNEYNCPTRYSNRLEYPEYSVYHHEWNGTCISVDSS